MQASVRAVETPGVSTAGPAATAPQAADASFTTAVGSDPDAPRADSASALSRRRVPQRAIELIGLALGIGVITSVTLGRSLSNDEFWQLAAGQWMLAHHAVVGLDPFSYTESHRRWITDEWGSEVALAALFRAFGAAAYNLYAIVLGSLSLLASMAYARTLGARGGRIAAIVMLLAIGVAAVVAGDRGLDFSLVFLPLELLVLARARTNPRWLWALPPLTIAWVNTHGSVLIGLLVLGVELGWSLVPALWAVRVGGTGRSQHTGALALTLLGCVLATGVTPYGYGLVTYDVGVTTNGQIAQYILEWNSPDFHSSLVLAAYAVPLAVLVLCIRNRRVPVLEGTLGALLFIEALRTQRLVIYLMVVAVGLAASLPARPAWSTTARRWAGAGLVVMGIAILAAPSVPTGSVSSSLPIGAFDYLSSHPGRIFTEYTWGDYSVARHRATFVDGRTDLFEGPVLTEFFDIMNLSIDPDPVFRSYGVDYVVWAPATALSEFLTHDPRWHVVDRTAVAWVFARTGRA